MSMKGKVHSPPFMDVDKKIFEIKKKIQLSEGQRKALFEEYKEEKTRQLEEIARLKTDVGQLLIISRDSQSNSAKNRIKSAKLGEIAGPLIEKDCEEVEEFLDLQVIDKVKQLDLINYQIDQRKQYLTSIAKEYQDLLIGKDQEELQQKVEIPLKKKTTELQNNIQSIDIQWKESMQVFNRYKEIKRTLQEDSTRFEYQIRLIEDDIRHREKEIQRLGKITTQAMSMKIKAYKALISEEKASLNEAKQRNKQEEDGRGLIQEEKQKLDVLEKSIFPPVKTTVRETDNEEDEMINERKTLPHPSEGLLRVFEQLKLTTGSTSPEEVLERFQTQRSTGERLTNLRNASEGEKRNLDKKAEMLSGKLEKLKLIEVKCLEQNAEEGDRIQAQMIEQTEQIVKLDEEIEKMDKLQLSIGKLLREMFWKTCGRDEEDIRTILHYFRERIGELLQTDAEIKQVETEEEINENEKVDEMLSIYSGLVAPSPFSQTGPSPIPTQASEEEEEVPTRGYLKRQGQLVIDTKTRRKTLRMLMNRRNITQ